MNKNEELNKSLDMLIDELFSENVEKSLDIAQDSKTTADAVVDEAPEMKNDDSNPGRPKEMHDVPQHDEDGEKSKDYDSAISEEDGEEENEEAKKQAKTMDQVKEEGRIAEEPKNSMDPRGPMFKSLTAEEYAEYQSLKKSKEEQETLKKAEETKKDQEALIKSAVESALGTVKKENEELRKSLTEQAELLKAIANKPKRPKSITNVNVIEKSMDPSTGTAKPESFSKSEILDAAFELAKSKMIPDTAVTEIEFTGTIANPTHRKLVEQKLSGK